MVSNTDERYASVNINEVAQLIKNTRYEDMTPDEQDTYNLCLQRTPAVASLSMATIFGGLTYKGVLRFAPKPVAAMLGISSFSMTMLCCRNIGQTACKLQALRSRIEMQVEQNYPGHQRTIQNAIRTQLLDQSVADSFDDSNASSEFHESTADTFLSDESIETMIASHADTNAKEKPKYTGSYDELLRKHRTEEASKQLSRLRPKQPAPAPAQTQQSELDSIDPQLAEPVFKTEFDEDEPKSKRGPRGRRNKYGDLID